MRQLSHPAQVSARGAAELIRLTLMGKVFHSLGNSWIANAKCSTGTAQSSLQQRGEE